MLKLKLQYFGHLIRRSDSLEKSSLVAQMVKHLPTMWETWVRPLGQEDPLEKKMQLTPVLLPGKSHGQRSVIGYSLCSRKESDTTEQLHFLSFFFFDAGKDWRQEEKGMTKDETVGWHHRLNGLEFEQAPGVGVGQGSLVCCSTWGHKELDTTELLNWTTDEEIGAQRSLTVCQGHTAIH